MIETDPIGPAQPVWPRRPVDKVERDEPEKEREEKKRRRDEDENERGDDAGSHVDEYA